MGASQLLGAALIGKQKFDQALTAFAKVVELRPDDASAYVNLALVEISLNRTSDAEQDLKKAVSIDPKSTQGYLSIWPISIDYRAAYPNHNKYCRAA